MKTKINYVALFSPIAIQVLLFFVHNESSEKSGPFHTLKSIQEETHASYMDILTAIQLFTTYGILTYKNVGMTRFYSVKDGSSFIADFKSLLNKFKEDYINNG